MELEGGDEGSQLCRSCGLCCDGSIFTHAPLVAGDDREVLERAGAVLTAVKDGLRLGLPCGALRGCECSVYEHRPDVCRGFRCALLRGVLKGKVTLVDAQHTTRRTAAMRDSLLHLLDDGQGSGIRKLTERFVEVIEVAPDPVAMRMESAETLLSIAEFRTVINRYFVNPSGS